MLPPSSPEDRGSMEDLYFKHHHCESLKTHIGLKVFQNRVLRRIFRSKRGKVTGG
jgi:hypothetical protein